MVKGFLFGAAIVAVFLLLMAGLMLYPKAVMFLVASAVAVTFVRALYKR